MTGSLPPEVRILFWDTDPDAVDLVRHSDYVVERVMTRGRWAAMRWLRATYETELLADFLRRKADRLTGRDLAYWGAVTGATVTPPRGGGRPRWTRP